MDSALSKGLLMEFGDFRKVEDVSAKDMDVIAPKRDQEDPRKETHEQRRIKVEEAVQYLGRHPEAFRKSLEAIVRKLAEEDFTKDISEDDIVRSIDLQEKLIKEYKNHCVEKIGRFVRFPRLARLLGQEGQVVVALSIDRTGKLEYSEIFLASDRLELDLAALEAIRKAAPYDAFPDDLSLKVLRFYTTITFDLDKK